ncbi:MAG: putative ATP-dependent helicase Lhr [Lentisphaerae bacterium ADurb.Bin082]|nr:MAG: putative ATP-dependent helicase Lhr [Lentisphaerae bacterium ADurb.Bin082]
MALNPLAFSETVIGNFLKYQMTAYPFQDQRLNEQMKNLLRLDHVRQSPLLKGPYVSLSQTFAMGCAVSQLVKDDCLHPHLSQLTPFPNVYAHQEEAIRTIAKGHTTLISTGTGSGKSECFLYPAISQALKLKDTNASAGISTVIVYPMNALAEDQLNRLRELLAGSGITFGIYVGKTPDKEAEVSGHRMAPGSSRADYRQQIEHDKKEKRIETIHPCEEVCSREMMRQNGSQPRILLTNVKQLELLLTRGTDAEMFRNATLDYLVFDEAHTFAGIMGSESACLVRRLKAFCNTQNHSTCIATSATIVDKDNPDAARDFAARFFGDDKANVRCITEQYQLDAWKPSGAMPAEPANPSALLQQCLQAVEKEDNDDDLARLYFSLAGRNVKSTLHDALLANPLAQLLSEQLRRPADLASLAAALTALVSRTVTESELMTYLVLGAAASKDGRAVFRPVVHAFIRGIPGGVVTFPSSDDIPKLWLSGEDEKQANPDEEFFPLRIFTCTTCGQHYFIHYVKDYVFTKTKPQGGDICEDETRYWEKLAPENDGQRVILVDRLISQDDDDDDEPSSARIVNVWFCRRCGTLHDRESARCKHCSGTQPMVKLYAVRQSEKNPGCLGSCLSCNSKGGGYRHKEPIREVRAVNVADVHVLAQEIIQHADRKRLLLFADNRQDAAFQAGWMKDHARRFRIAAIIDDILEKHSNITVGDLVLKLCNYFDDNEEYSKALLTEVWNQADKKKEPVAHAKERRKYLTIQVMREVCLGTRKRVGLESWGRLQVSYDGIQETAPQMLALARKYRLAPVELFAGIVGLLDYLRWKNLVYVQEYNLNNKFFGPGDQLIERGYLINPPNPQGCKFTLESNDDARRMIVFSKEREQIFSTVFQKWGIAPEKINTFKADVWNLMQNTKILVPVKLLGQKGNPLPRCSGLYQLDLTKLRLNSHTGYYKCRHCSRKTLHKTPYGRCLAWRCQGELEYVAEPPDSYDLHVLEEGYALIRPEEHTAMVPHERREYIENCFKSDSDNQVNTLVCTPTLELGVDIGGLDCTLMRNVPPSPANYWQRVGRAGRRNRMAVNITYCRPTSYDKAYYEDPLKMLEGRIDPPAFNLRNGNLIEKHVHALLLTATNQLIYGDKLPPEEQHQLKEARDLTFPPRIDQYLFDHNRNMRHKPYEFNEFSQWLHKYQEHFHATVIGVFSSAWPENDAEVVTPEILTALIQDAPGKMEEVAKRLFRRLQWANREIKRLEKQKGPKGTFDNNEDKAHWRRCDNLIQKFKGLGRFRKRRSKDLNDDISTYGVLASEGFLPGYGLDTGSICASGEMPSNAGGYPIYLPRPTTMALREYVPGNLLYANGQKFVPRQYLLTTGEEVQERPTIAVDKDKEAIMELPAGSPPPSGDMELLQAIYICDVELMHEQLISDDEENRFQMPIMHYAIEKNKHNGGTMYSWGPATLQWRKNVHFRMFNVGTPGATDDQFGYLVCQICGHSISPLSSKKAIEKFAKGHEERCGTRPQYVGFYADVMVDCLKLADCADRTVAYSLMEALRLGAAHVLDMHLDDLQVMVIGRYDSDTVDAYLWDPMPGGSGILNQILENPDRICETALELLDGCSSNCEKSCIDCLQNFRNAFYHRYLDRHSAMSLLRERLGTLREIQIIPATTHTSEGTTPDSAMPTNNAEQRLKLLMEKAGLLEGEWQHQIRFKTKIESLGFGSTTPDVFFAPDDDEDANDRGCCVYLDGMSAGIHGNPETQAKDKAIRAKLRSEGYQVVEITVHDLHDKEAMRSHFSKIARYVVGRDFSRKIKDDPSWFQ